MAPPPWGAPPPRRSWSRRRTRLLLALAGAAVLTGIGALTLPDELGVTAAFAAALCGLLLVAAAVVFLSIRGPDTFGQLVRMSPLAGSVTVVAVLLALSNAGESLRWAWLLAAVAAAGWTAFAVVENRRSGR